MGSEMHDRIDTSSEEAVDTRTKDNSAAHVETLDEKTSPRARVPNYSIDAAHQKKVIRKIDIRLLPILGMMYSISLVDRTNLGLAMVAGMEEQLGLDVGDRYTIIVMIFFVCYIIFEIPSNLVLPKAGPANWLAFLGVSFGAILIGMGFTRSWGTLALCRALLGMLEAGYVFHHKLASVSPNDTSLEYSPSVSRIMLLAVGISFHDSCFTPIQAH